MHNWDTVSSFHRLLAVYFRTEPSPVQILLRSASVIGMALLLLLPQALSAAVTSTLSGTLSDTQGRVVPNATITILRRADSSRRETTTDVVGQLPFPTWMPASTGVSRSRTDLRCWNAPLSSGRMRQR